MRFFGDYHTHSPYSHGKSEIKENIAAAEKEGLKEIAITDHGFSHALYAVKREDIPVMRREINDVASDVKVYLGIEANLLNAKGDIDIRLDEIFDLDVLILGYHRFVKGGFAGFSLPNLLTCYTHIGLSKRRVVNTDALARAVEKYPIDIISHPGADFPIDITEIAEVCAHFGTFLELNRKRMISDDDMRKALATDVKFIASSDAHSADKVGDFTVAEELIKRLDVPFDRIANLEKFPVFRSGKIPAQR